MNNNQLNQRGENKSLAKVTLLFQSSPDFSASSFNEYDYNTIPAAGVAHVVGVSM